MLIRDNPTGRRSLRSYSYNRGKLSKSLEKLSSGYKINRSADDAAGLAISEKMRAHITGTNRAYSNSAEGTSLLQIGEGALDEIHQMLNRAEYLADSSANGTYQDEIDREALQRELDQLCGEIDRITKTTRFNSIHLFQDKGYDYETTAGAAFPQEVPLEPPGKASQELPPEETGAVGGEAGVRIVYTEHESVTAAPSPSGTDGKGSLEKVIHYADGSTKKLSQVLEEEIVPNIVKNVMRNYPAFSYLQGSSIGIGLEYFSEGALGGTTTLAAVRVGFRSDGQGDYLNYTLRVNTQALKATGSNGELQRDDLQDLEATIAHEMVHAFMDEATTAGMIGWGRDPVSPGGSTQQVDEFPSWFIEGMAQTASGPDNWLSHIGIIANSTDRDISNAVSRAQLGSNTGESDYGTGYLACMYLGAVIGGGKQPAGVVSGETILVGLNRLMNSIIGGKSLDSAIEDLTDFTGLADFQNKFNGGSLSASIGAFTRGLLRETGSGRGGLISGDLSAADLAPDVPDLSVTLFKLDPNSNSVQNTYPPGYEIYSGGAASADGVPPTGFTESNLQKEFGEFLVTGAADADIEYDASNHILKVKAGGDIKISMKTPGAMASADKIVVEASTTGKITLDGIQTSQTLTVEDGAKVEFEIEGENQIDQIELGTSGVAEAAFSGSGTLKVNTFDSDASDLVTFRSGAVIVGGGAGTIDAKAVVDKAFIGASLTGTVTNSAGNTVSPISIPWNDTALGVSLDSVTSMTVDGAEYQASLPNGQQGNFWFDPNTAHRVTFGGTSGGKKVQKTLVAEADSNKNLTWKEPDIPFTVTGDGVRDTDWSYDAATNTLKILKADKGLTISGGTMMNDDGTTTIGRIEIADDICADPANPTAPGKTVKLNLSGLDCVMNTNQSAMSLGNNNNVLLTLADGSINNLTSGASHAGIAIGTGTNLTIDGSTGTLNATGGTNGAGIGRSSGSSDDMTSSITVKGGNITAIGGTYGAGIGCVQNSNFGDITIEGGSIHAEGGSSGGAGIGAALYAKTGNITIHGGSVTAKSNGHGAGIGGGWGSSSTNGDIFIDGGSITALSLYHGTGIGCGCQGTSGKITITGNAVIESALGGDDGAGIGASWIGTCTGIEISGNAEVKLAQGGDKGAGIGAGSSGSKATNTPAVDANGNPIVDANGNPVMVSILVDTTGQVNAKGGQNGVGIGSGCDRSSVGDIWIKQGTVSATGSTDATGIGCGRDSTSADITIGDPGNESSKVIVSATGGLTNAGGNILSYTNPNRTDGTEGKLIVTGNNTSVRPGAAGEGKYSTSGAVAADGTTPLYAYPLYLFQVPDGTTVLEAGENASDYGLPLPEDATNIQISVDGVNLDPTLTHKPLDENYTFIWMTGGDHKVEVSYTSSDTSKPSPITLDLKFHDNAGVFRTEKQKDPPDASKPEYNVKDPPKPSVDPDFQNPAPSGPSPSRPVPEPEPEPEPEPPREYGKGLILQIGAKTGETLEIPLFYLSRDSLRLGELNISTQENAWRSMPIIREAINRVSSIRGSYGAYMNRLEHNRADLSQSAENLSDAESNIRDTDFAKEYMDYVKQNIQMQAAQSMLAHSNQDANRVLQLIV